MEFFKKIQSWPESRRKIILWTIVIIIGILLFTFYFKNVQKRLKDFKGEDIKEQLKIPELQEKLKEIPRIEMPEIEIPEISEEELKKLEEKMIKEESYEEE